jgi:hypothetical protein
MKALAPMLAVSCLVAACGSQDSFSRITAPSGGKGYEITCRSKGYCYKLAGILCPTGYNTVDQANPHSLVVECKGTNDTAP